MLDFRPPKDNPLVIGLLKFFLPFILKAEHLCPQVKILGDGAERFKTLNKTRTVICPNHSYRHDPEAVFDFSKIVGEDFNFIAAREVFDWNMGFNGWLFQNSGVYSVVRGAADRESFKMTKSLIVAGKKKLVIFPEGEISKQNDVLLPLEGGSVQLAFWAQDELHKTAAEEPVVMLPLALKYFFVGDVTEKLAQALERLEEKVGIKNNAADPENTLYKRVRTVAFVVLKALEEQYSCKTAADDTLNQRLEKIRTAALKNMAALLDVQLPDNYTTHLDWVRILRNAMDDFIYGDTEDLAPYQKKIHDERAGKISNFYHDLDRIVSFIAIFDGYLRSPISQERMSDVIELLEWEVFRKLSVKGIRQVTILVGQPINLLDSYEKYKGNKKAVIGEITNSISKQLSDMLKQMDESRQTVYVN